jgi:GT2 family glycosyltransferase
MTRATRSGAQSVALARDGARTSRSGEVLIDPGARHRRRLAEGASGQPSAEPLPSSGGAELRLCVTEGASRAALRDSLDAQTYAPASVTDVGEGLETALESLLDSGHAAAVFVDSRDALDPRALASLAARFGGASPPDVLYSDHDVLDSRGRRSDPFRKPGWSPELLLSLPYVGSFVAVGRAAAEAALRLGGDGLGSVHALLLAVVDEPLQVERIPEVLWTRDSRAWSEVSEREDAALREVARRRGARLGVGRTDPDAGIREVTWELEEHPAVSIVIPTAGLEMPLSACLRSLRDRTVYPDVEIVLVDSGGGAAGAAAARALDGVEHRVAAFDGDGQFNFSRACNVGAQAARGEYLVFLNDDTEALGEEWLERMVAQAQLPATGVVGAKLLYPGGLVQHAGLVLDRLPAPVGVDFVASQFAFHQETSSGPHHLLDVPRDCSAVTGACLMVRAEVLSELGGWDEGFRLDFGDVDICLRAIEAGWRVIVEPRAKLLHQVHAFWGYVPHDEDDTRQFMNRWAMTYADGDPWYHPACAFGRDWELH